MHTKDPVDHYAVIDFETTGLSPAHGARPTEIAVVLVRGDEIVVHVARGRGVLITSQTCSASVT